MNRAQARVFAGVTIACLVLAAGVALTPLGSPAAHPTRSGIVASDVALPGIPEGTWDRDPYWEIVTANVLSPTRQGPDPEAPPWTLERPEPEPPPRASPTPSRPRYRLSGIVGSPEGFLALIDADPRIPGAELYRVGDQVGPFRLTEANDSIVVLSGPSGTQVLRLETN